MKKSYFIGWLDANDICPPTDCKKSPKYCHEHWTEFLAALEPDDEEPTEANSKERATMSEIKPDRYAGSWACSADSCSQWDDETPEGGLTPCKMLQEMDYTPCQEALLRENVTLKARVRELEVAHNIALSRRLGLETEVETLKNESAAAIIDLAKAQARVRELEQILMDISLTGLSTPIDSGSENSEVNND
jgi:hypothetical protein